MSLHLQNLARSLPSMMQILKDVGGVELPDYIARFSDGKAPAATSTAGATSVN